MYLLIRTADHTPGREVFARFGKCDAMVHHTQVIKPRCVHVFPIFLSRTSQLSPTGVTFCREFSDARSSFPSLVLTGDCQNAIDAKSLLHLWIARSVCPRVQQAP